MAVGWRSVWPRTNQFFAVLFAFWGYESTSNWLKHKFPCWRQFLAEFYGVRSVYCINFLLSICLTTFNPFGIDLVKESPAGVKLFSTGVQLLGFQGVQFNYSFAYGKNENSHSNRVKLTMEVKPDLSLMVLH